MLRFGCYADFISIFRSELRAENIKIMFFEALRQDARAFMVELSQFLGIDASCWASFDFRPSNTTFSGRNRALHRLAVRTNAVVEPLMRRYPRLKQSLVRAYKAMNQERAGYDPLPPRARQRLIDFYAPGVAALKQCLAAELPAGMALPDARGEGSMMSRDLDEQMTGARVAFLVGAGRSGTTLLYKLLCLHPQVAYISNYENRFRWVPDGLACRAVARAHQRQAARVVQAGAAMPIS